jgi:hypothetical protein
MYLSGRRMVSVTFNSALLLGLNLCLNLLSQVAFAEKASVKNIKNVSLAAPIFGEWFAVGSGCKATHKVPGNVQFKGDEYTAGKVITGKFELLGYKLSSPPENPKTSLAFARECNLRVKIQPPKHKKIVSVSSKTTVVASKDAALKLSLQNTLYMDTHMVGAYQNEIKSGEKVGNREFEVILSKGVWQGLAIPENASNIDYACGQAMVFGSDFTAIAHRKSQNDEALVQLKGSERQLDFSIELEDCKS